MKIWVRAAVTLLASTLGAQAADKVRFGTNWLAQAEHGGFYQAVVDGTYARYGLDVEIVQGGPQSNTRLMLPTGRLGETEIAALADGRRDRQRQQRRRGRLQRGQRRLQGGRRRLQ